MLKNRRGVQIAVLLTAGLLFIAARPSDRIAVSVTFRCPATAQCVSPDAVQGDWQGTYCCDANTYFFNGNNLQMYVNAPRSFFLDFTRPDGPAPCTSTSSGCRISFTTVTTPSPIPGTEVIAVDANDNMLPNGFFSIAVGSSTPGRMKINFPDPSGRSFLWTVRFNPVAYPGSSYVTITRTATNSWTVEASGTDVARLVSTTTSGKAITTDEGLYYMPFQMNVVQ